MSHYAKFVTFQVSPGQTARLVEILRASKQLADEAQGHKKLTIGVSKSSADTICMFDVWESREAHDAFQQQSEQIALVNQAIPLMSDEPVRHEIDVSDL